MSERTRGKYEGVDEALLALYKTESFRPGQKEVIDAIMQGRDVLGVLPTGSGKTACHVLPMAVEDGRTATLVVSPLVALMRAQVQDVRGQGFRAAALHSGLDPSDRVKLFERVGRAWDFVFTSPEQLGKPDVREAASKGSFGRVVVDEAHCVSVWGDSFRPDYMSIGSFVAAHDLQVAALTATATHSMRADIVGALGMEDPFIHVESPFRENLRFNTQPVSGRNFALANAGKYEAIKAILGQASTGQTVIFCGSQIATERLATQVKADLRANAVYYHAGMDKERRVLVERAFASGEVPCLFATNAFGMGMDFSNIRRVIHHDAPDSPLALLQEAGRAGRDGGPAECTLLWADQDKNAMEWKISQRLDYAFIKRVRGLLLGQMRSKSKDIGDFFGLNLYPLYQAMNANEAPELKSKIRSAITVLQQHGFIGKNTQGEICFPEPIDLNGEKEGIFLETLQRSTQAYRALTEQMVEYAQGQGSQERLIEFMER